MRPKLKAKSDRYTENRNNHINDIFKVTIGGESKNNADMMLYATVVLQNTTLIKKTEDTNYIKFWSDTDKIEDTITIELGKVPDNVERIMITIAPDSEFSRLRDINGYWITESDLLDNSSRHEFYNYVTDNTKEMTIAEIIFNNNGTISTDVTK